MGHIYQIRNLVNGKVYIGSTDRTFERRRIEHVTELRGGYHDNKYLQKSWNKYGEENFIFSVIDYTDNPEQTHEREKYWIDYYVALLGEDNTYNIMPVEKSSYGKPRPFSESQKEKMSVAAKERCADPIGRERMREIGRRGTESRKRNGVKPTFSEEGLASLSAKMKARWVSGEMTGRPITDAQKDILRKRQSKVWAGFISPDGIEYRDIENLIDFAERFNLNASGLRSLANGKLYAHKGWTYINPKEKSIRVYGPFVSPDGKVYSDIKNLTEFCKEHGLAKSGMSRLENGKIQVNKGWTKLIE